MSESADPSSSSRYFKLGLFMVFGVAILVTSIVLLGAGELFKRTISAETLVYESVSGLEVGSPVKYRGVPIGKVTAIIFADVKYPQSADSVNKEAGRDIRGILIEMSLTSTAFPGQNQDQTIAVARQLIDKGLRARVTPAGISGQSYIDCDILNPADYPPLTINWKPDNLYVPSAPSSIGQVLDAAEQIANELKKANLGKVVGHIDDLAMQAKTTIADADRLIDANRENINKTVAELPDAAAKLRMAMAKADQILHDPRVDKAINNLSAATESAQAALIDIRNLARDAEGLLSGETEDVRSILADLRRLAADGAAITDDARQNPSRLFFGKPPTDTNNQPHHQDGKQ